MATPILHDRGLGDGRVKATPQAPATSEVVSGGMPLWLGTYLNFLHTLPHYIDDLSRDFGDDIYERMRLDPQVLSDLNTLKMGILSGGLSCVPAVKEGEDEYELAAEIKAFCEYTLENLAHPFLTRTLPNLLDALSFGNKVAEKVYRSATPTDLARFPLLAQQTQGGALILAALKVKPRQAVAFVVDAFMNPVGMAALKPGMLGLTSVQTFAANSKDLLPLSKFAVLTFNPSDEDPRGQSIHRSAYQAWWTKMQNWGEYLKFLTLFAGPSLWIEMPENAQPFESVDASGNPVTINPKDEYMAAGQAVRAGSVGVGAFGSKVSPLQAAGEGGAYTAAIDLCNREISKAHVLSTLATMEGEHQARAASATHKDVLDLLIAYLKGWVQDFVENQIWKPAIEINYGVDACRFCPQASLGDTTPEDMAGMYGALGMILRADPNYFTPVQKQWMDANLLRVQPRTDEDVQEEIGQKQKMADLAASPPAPPANPNDPSGDNADDPSQNPPAKKPKPRFGKR